MYFSLSVGPEFNPVDTIFPDIRDEIITNVRDSGHRNIRIKTHWTREKGIFKTVSFGDACVQEPFIIFCVHGS